MGVDFFFVGWFKKPFAHPLFLDDCCSLAFLEDIGTGEVLNFCSWRSSSNINSSNRRDILSYCSSDTRCCGIVSVVRPICKMSESSSVVSTEVVTLATFSLNRLFGCTVSISSDMALLVSCLTCCCCCCDK